MKYQKQSAELDLIGLIEHQEELKSINKGLNRLSKVIDFEIFREELEDILEYNKRDGKKGGRPPFDSVFMFRILVIQKYHGLSDEATEEAIKDRLSFMNFLGIMPGDAVPDKNTIWDFREALDRDGRKGSERLFALFNRELQRCNIIAREGSIVDASFVDAPRQRNSREENDQIKRGKRPESFDDNPSRASQKDTDARWAVKNKEVHFGYKNHVKVDAKTKLIISYTTTSCNVHDSQVLKALVDEKDEAIVADSAYFSEQSSEYVIGECDCQDFIMSKGQRNKPLTEQDTRANKWISRVRSRVEHVFGQLKHMGADFIRTIGLKRASAHNALVNLVYNLNRCAYLVNSLKKV